MDNIHRGLAKPPRCDITNDLKNKTDGEAECCSVLATYFSMLPGMFHVSACCLHDSQRGLGSTSFLHKLACSWAELVCCAEQSLVCHALVGVFISLPFRWRNILSLHM